MTVTEAPSATPEDRLRRFRETRDPEELGALFEATAPSLLRVALSIAPDAASAENALQETFLAVLAAPERWDATRPVMPWLLGILHRQVGAARRDRARTPDPLRVVPRLDERDPAANASTREEQERVRDAIDGLAEPYRQVALLRWRHGLEPSEIAHLRGEPPGTTRSLLSRALEKLRARLGPLAVFWFGRRDTRGLDAIGREIVRRAARANATAAGAAVVVGGLVMKKVVAAMVAVVLLALGGWGIVEWTRDDGDPANERAAVPPATNESPRRRTREAAEPAADSPTPPVDFASVDPERDIAGHVLGPDGAPVARARVVARAADTRRQFPGQTRDTSSVRDDAPLPSTRTATDGSFRLRLDPETPVELVVRATGFAEQIRAGCRAGHHVTIRLAAGESLVVEVVDAAEKPVEGVTVFAIRQLPYGDPLQELEAPTGADGCASFSGLLPGLSSIEVGVPGVAERFTGGQSTAPDGVRRVVLGERVRLEGTVTDRATNAPIPGATVAEGWGDEGPWRTDASGRYRLTLWKWKGSNRVKVWAPGFGLLLAKVESPGTADFVLDRAVTVRGRAVAEDGTPIAAARASVVTFPPGFLYSHVTDGAVGADGRFAIDAAAPGAVQALVVESAGRQRAVVELPTSAPRGGIDVGDVVVARGRRISGVVADSEGRPCAGDRVDIGRPRAKGAPPTAAELAGSGYHMVITDDLGRFRFDSLVPGKWDVCLNVTDSPKVAPVSVVLQPDRDVTDVRLVLAGSRTLTVRIVDDTGAAIPQSYAALTGDFAVRGVARDSVQGYTDADGRIRFRGLPAILAELTASAPGERPYLSSGPPHSVTPNGQEVTVVLDRAVTITGRLLDEEDKPLARHYVDAIAASAQGAGMDETRADGSFKIVVRAGQAVDLRLRDTRAERGADGKSHTVAVMYESELPGVRGPVEGLLLRATKVPPELDRTVTIVVVDTAGNPVDGIQVFAGWSGQSVRSTSDSAGRAFLGGLPARRIRVTFNAGARRAKLTGLQVPPVRMEFVPEGGEVRAPFRLGVEIRGRVVDASGRPVRASVSVRTPDYAYTRAECDEQGRFVVAALPDVAHVVDADLWVNGEHFLVSRAGVFPGASDIELVVRPIPK